MALDAVDGFVASLIAQIEAFEAKLRELGATDDELDAICDFIAAAVTETRDKLAKQRTA